MIRICLLASICFISFIQLNQIKIYLKVYWSHFLWLRKVLQHNLNIEPKQVLHWWTIPSTSTYPCFCDSAPASLPTLIAQFMLIGLHKFQAYTNRPLNSKEVQKHTYVLVRKAGWVFYYTGCKCNKNASFF